MATQNPYSDSLLMDALRGSLSNAESLGRGFGVAPVGLLGDINALARQYVTPRLPQSVQGLLQSAPAAPTTEQILSNIPRVSNPRMETAGMEQLGAAMNPRGPVDLAKGVGRVAGNAINEAMVYDRGLLSGITPQPMRMDVYHGTPHRFDAFDASKIGTGEGAQSFGHGLYFGEARGTGETYRKQLAKENLQMDLGSKLNLVDIGGTPLTKFNVDQSPELLEAAKAGKTEFVDLAKSKLGRWEDLTKDESYPFPDYAREKVTAYTGLLDEVKNKDVSYSGSGYLYKVDLPDEAIAKMLDWDKPLSKQPTVMNALRSEAEQRVKDRKLADIENDIRSSLPKQDIGNDYMAMFSDANVAANQDIQAQALSKLNKMDLKDLVDKELETMKPVDMNWNMTGKEFYELLSKREGSPEKASAMLQSQGVTGNRYLDQGSRVAGGSDTSNFVVFPQYQDLLTIKEINDQPVQGLLGR